MAKKAGKLIVIEGSDGSGKTTQSKLLLKYLEKNKIPAAYVSFPRYKESMWADMVTRYLLGEFGKIDEVDPYFASMLYAGDRYSASSMISKWLEEGKVVVCNRYVGSNIGHMAAKMKGTAAREKYMQWLEKLEYVENGIPKEDLVVLLQVEPTITRKLMKARNLDIHEKNQKYQEEVYGVYDWVASKKKNWIKVDCTDKGKIQTPEEISKKVVDVLRRKNIV